MKEVIEVLQHEIIEAIDMRLKYEKIQLQAMKDNTPNMTIDSMVQYYKDRITQFENAIKILNNQP